MKATTIILFIALLMFTLGENILYAGTTGKIAGKITDAATGEPLISANIVIGETSLGAASDIDGNYVILNIPPGIYTVTVSMIGYRKVQIDNVKVAIDLTASVDANLQSEAVELETIVITAQRPMVIKDNTGSLTSFGADQIKSLPVQNVTQVLQLNAGVIISNGRLSIRGGRTSEVGYWVDGISVTDAYDGSMGLTVENSAIQELQVISGTFNAEYGQAMSGIVNTVTKQGEKRYTGQIQAYIGNYLSYNDRYSLYKKLRTEKDPSSGLTKIIESEKDYPLKRLNPIYNGELTLSGPIPLDEDLTFFTNARYFNDRGYFYGRNWYKPNGAPVDSSMLSEDLKRLYAANSTYFGESSLVPMNPLERISLQGKITYQLNSDIKLSYNVFWSQSKRERNYYGGGTAAGGGTFNSHDYKYNPYGLPQNINKASTQIFTLNHVLSSSSFYEFHISRYYSHTKQYVYENPYASVKYLVHVKPSQGFVEEIFDPYTPAGQVKLDSLQSLSGVMIEWIADPNGPDGYIDPTDVTTAPTGNSFMNKGFDPNHTDRSTANWIGKFDFTNQLSKTQELKLGAETRFHELTLHSYRIIARKDNNNVEITPFLPAIPEVGNINRNDYYRTPKEFSAYIQDKMEFNDIILNLGLRFDYFDANSVIPSDPSDPNIYAPFKYGHIYAGVPDSLKELIQGYDQYIDAQLAAGNIREYTPKERRKLMHKNVDPKMALSPRIGIAFPITDRGVIHFSYGHFFQMPDFQYLYQNPDFKITSGSGDVVFGNTDLRPQRTVMYEIGLQQQLSEDIGVDATLFYRDVRDWVGTSAFDTTAYLSVRYSMFENKDYENVRGIVLKFEKRYANNFSFRADYTYQIAEGTYSNPTDEFNANVANRAPVIALLPMNWDQRHTINAQLIYDISDWTFSLIGRYWSGKPYTPNYASAEASGASAVTGFTQNSARLSDQKIIDLTINKTFRLGSHLTLGFFVNVYNLLDQGDATWVYTDTGTPEYTTNPRLSSIEYNEDRVEYA